MLTFFINKESIITNLHPVTRILCLIVLFTTPFLFNHPLYLLPLFLIFIATAIITHALKNLWRVSWIGFMLFIMSVVLWPFFYKGVTPFLNIGNIILTKEGVYFALSIALRLNCFLVLGIIFLTATRLEDITTGLNKLGLPYVISFSLSLAFRLTPLFMDSAMKVVTAQKARGLEIDKGSLLSRAKKHFPVIVPVLFIGLKKADQLAIALESKGFGNSVKRYHYLEHQVTKSDIIAYLMVLGLLVLLVSMRYRGIGILAG